MKEIGFAPNIGIKEIVEDGFKMIDEGEGFEYIVGKTSFGEFKVVFEPHSNDFSSVEIDGVDGFGFSLIYEK